MEEEIFNNILQKMKCSKRNRNESYKSELKESYSDTNFIILLESEQRKISHNIISSKSKNHYNNILYKQNHSSNCKNCNNFQKLLKKDKTELSIYIENNLKFLKLFGNQRYNESSPSLFVQDYKKKLSEKKMGLVPIPDKRNRAKSVNNHYKLYNLQRSIVMVRRYQYARANLYPANNACDITLIHKWAKNLGKIILIQKNFRGYFIRKQVDSILNLYRFMHHFENTIIKIKIRNSFVKILKSTAIPRKRKPNKGYFFIKEILVINKKILKKIITIQNNFRAFKSKKIYKIILREHNFIVRNKIEFISKILYNNNEKIYEKINKIQYNVRKFLRRKGFIERKIIHKDIGIFYMDKNYIDYYSKKIISFYKLIKHGLQIFSLKKIRSKYKKLDEYKTDDINKVILIQKIFLNYYYFKNLKNRLINKKMCFVGKIRLKRNINKIILIQNKYRQYILNKNQFIKKIIRNKPISSPKSIQSNKKSKLSNFVHNKIKIIKNIHNFNDKFKAKTNHSFNDIYSISNEDKLVNNICYISKESKRNIIHKFLFLQTKIYSYLFLKNLKNKERIKSVNKNDFRFLFIITKVYSNENYCINKIKNIQNLYKKEYKYLKSNIIEYYSSIDDNKNELKNNENTFEDDSINIIKTITDKNSNLNNVNSIKNSQNKNEIYLPPKGKSYNNIINKKSFQNQKIYKKDNSKPVPNNNKYYIKFNKDFIQKERFLNKRNVNINKVKKEQIEDKIIKTNQILLDISKNKNGKLTLREIIKKNKLPRKELTGNYISKKRVEKRLNENYLNFNLKIFHKVKQLPIHITKTRIYNNEFKIKIIQIFWKKIYNLRSIKKPLPNFSKEKEIKEIKFENEKINTKDNNIKNKFIPKKRNKLPFIKENSDSFNNIKKSNFLPNTYDNDEPFEFKNSRNNKNANEINYMYNNLNKFKESNNFNNISNNNYITKIRKINYFKYILLLQKCIRNFIFKKIKVKKLNLEPSIISKFRISQNAYNNFITTLNERKIIMKIPKKEKLILKNILLSFSNTNNLSEKIENEINNDIYYISKNRYYNNINYIEKIQKNWRIKINNKIINKKQRLKKCFICKNRFKNNIKEIIKIQRIYRAIIFRKNEEKNKIISRKTIFLEAIYKEKQKNKNSIKNKENNLKIKNSKSHKIERNYKNISKKVYLNNSINKNFNLNINNDKNIIKNLEINNKFPNEVKVNEFSYSKINYISKIYKILVYKKHFDIEGIYFISKTSKKFKYQNQNLIFISLLNLIIIKNVQEFIFHLLKYNSINCFTYPFYNKTLQRVIKFLKSFPSSTQGGEKLKKFFLKIFPNLYSQKSVNILIASLNKENEKQLINTNIYNSIEPDFINYICSFSKYDKHLSNSIFIEARLKNSKLLNTNIFNITRFIDDEYNNLINGKYCLKCYLDKNKCICNKKNEEEYYYDDEDGIDIDFDIDYYNKNKFEYNRTKCKGTTINRKPKDEEVYEDPITNLILKNKEDYIDSRGQIANYKINSTNLSGSQFGSNSSFGTNFNSKILNKIKNNISSENNSLNNSKNISKIKAIYHQNNNKKKENMVLIKNNENDD